MIEIFGIGSVKELKSITDKQMLEACNKGQAFLWVFLDEDMTQLTFRQGYKLFSERKRRMAYRHRTFDFTTGLNRLCSELL